MIRYTALLRCSFKPNYINTSSFLTIQPQNGSFQPLLVGRIQFLDSSLKRRQFKFNQSFVAFPEHLKTQINDFPYCRIPKHTQQFTQNRQLSQEQYQMLAAFNSLFIVNEQYKQDLLRQILKILLKQDYNKVKLQNLTGEKVFTYYYQKKLPTIIRQINQNLIQQNQKVYYFQILANLVPTEAVKSHVQTLNENIILASNLHVQSLYLKLKIKHDSSYVDIVENIYSQLISESKDQQQKIRLSAAKALISISNYEQFLPQNLQSLSLRILIENIERLSAMENIMIIKHIYMSKYQICHQYMQVLTHKVVKLQEQNKGEQLHVPLILKMIKYRKKQNLSNQMFIQIINSYPQKFNTVFREKNTNKQIFMSLLIKQSNNSLNNDLRMQFGSYITKLFEEYQKKQQIDEQELVKNMKLILKYTSQLNKQQVTKLISILVNNLYERMKHVASEQTKYYIFLTTYTCDYNQKVAANKSFETLIQQISAFYDKQCLQQPNYQNITKAINIEYQLCRRGADDSLRLNVFKYDYRNVQLHASVYSYLFYLMKKERNIQNNQKVKVLNQLKTKIYKDLSYGRFSMKMVYTLIDVLAELKYDDKYLYRDIEKNIGKRLRETLQRKRKQIPLVKDLHFMKDKLMRDEKCSKKLAELIVEGQKNYDRIQELVQDYLEKSKNWQKIRQNYARNKSKQTKKYQNFQNK